MLEQTPFLSYIKSKTVARKMGFFSFFTTVGTLKLWHLKLDVVDYNSMIGGYTNPISNAFIESLL